MTDDPMVPRVIAATGTINAGATMTANAAVRRGDAAYTYLYVVLALLLGLFWTLVQVWPSLPKVIVVLAGTVILVHLLLFNGWAQNKTIGLKNWYESKFRQAGPPFTDKKKPAVVL